MVYIGETERHIGVRAAEHVDISVEKPTAVAKHIIGCESCFCANEQGRLSFKDFSIIKQCRSKYDAEI